MFIVLKFFLNFPRGQNFLNYANYKKVFLNYCKEEKKFIFFYKYFFINIFYLI